ncbi:MAG: GMC family oxidoreductase [Chloroflexota bacterium]|nr:GMC family oxidoreductase [Chloroflexota bacterium]
MGTGADTFDTIVVGSGFGGSIAALRLAESGQRVCVVERGRSYHERDFPRDPFAGQQLLWRHPARRDWTGLYDLRFLSGILTLAAAGLGGGSLIFANVLIRPHARVFDERWPSGVDLAGLSPFYGRVESEIGASPLPSGAALAKDSAMEQAVERVGRSDGLVSPPLGVDWKACELIAECEFGCPTGAKRTLDQTYLARARALGAELRTRTRAIGIEPVRGGYRVTVASVPERQRSVLTAPRVVLAAGTLGTAELLLRARDQHGTLPRLSRRLGERFSGNGDFIGLIVETADPLEPWRGPDVTAVLRAFDQDPGITIATPTFAPPMMAALAGSARLNPAPLRPFGGLLWPVLDDLVHVLLGNEVGRRLVRSAIARGLDEPAIEASRHTTAVFAIGRDSGSGRLVLQRKRGARRLDVEWDYPASEAALVTRQQRLLDQLAGAYGGRFLASPMWALARRTGTVHPLGGAIMGQTAEEGVVSPAGEVHGYPGLFVTDASVIPTSIGFHPVLTISANAERIASAIIGSL